MIVVKSQTYKSLFLLIMCLSVCFIISCSCHKTSLDSDKKKATESNKEDVTLMFWNTMTPLEAQQLLPFFDKFMVENPNIKVKWELVDFWQAKQKFEQACKAGVPPNIFRADRFWVRQLAEAGLIEEIPYTLIKEEIEDCLPIALQVVKWSDKIWGLPHSVDCLGLFYNKSHFLETGAKVPTNFDEFREAARKTTDYGKGRYGFFINPDGWWFEPFIVSFGGQYFDAAGQLIINSDKTLKATHYLLDLKDVLKVVPPVNLRTETYGVMMRSFKTGQVSMIFNGPWAIRDILEGSAFKDKSDNLGVAPIPVGPTGRFTPVGCQVYVIPKGAPNFNEAVMLAKYLCSTEVALSLSKSNFGIPTRKSLFFDPELRKDPFLGPFMLQLQECQYLETNPDMQLLFQSLGEYLRKVLNGEVAPEDALKDLETNWKGKK